MNSGIWIAEDDADDRMLFERVLLDIGITEHFRFFSNGRVVLTELMQPGTLLPRVLILDGHMPVLNGWDVIEVLHHTEQRRVMQIVLLSGTLSQLDQQKSQYFQVPVQQKPLHLHQMIELFQKILQQDKVRQAQK